MMPEEEKAHVSVMKNCLLPHEICLNIVPSEALPFKIIKSVHEELQDSLKQKTLKNCQATEKAENQDSTALDCGNHTRKG